MGSQPQISDSLIACRIRQDESERAVDFSRQLWKDALGGNAVAPIDRDEFRQAYFKQAEDPGLFTMECVT